MLGGVHVVVTLSSCHPDGLAPCRSSIGAFVTELLFDSHQLVVLRIPVGPARGTCLDLASAEADCQVGNGSVLSLAGSVRAHDAPTVLLAQLHSLDGLANRADLVHLQEEGVAGLVLDGLLHSADVGDGQVVTNNLARLADGSGELGPGSPVVLVERVLDGDDRVVLDKACVELGQLLARHLEVRGLLGLRVPSAEVIDVLTLDLELRGSNIHTNLADVLVASLLDGLHDELDTLLGVAGRGEATLVTDQGGITTELLLDDALEGVVALAADSHGLLEGGGADRDDEVLLEGQLVACVGAAVDHVEARHRQGQLASVAGQLGEVLVERHTLRFGGGLSSSHGDTQDSVGSELALVGGAIQSTHLVVQGLLLKDVEALQLRVEDSVHRLDGLGDALAEVPALVAISQLASLVDTRGSTRRHSSTGNDATLRLKIDLDGRVASAVQDLTCLELLDLSHLGLHIGHGTG
mmetsp:Transcript_79159/g.173575  ORF Transcript_79159/g.173575 Transcript_79159/m.173575 type:complete len:466 (-) Transcript_79159:120-1517(-)